MTPKSPGVTLIATLAIAATPLACGDHENSPGGSRRASEAGGAGAPATGGSEPAGGMGGEPWIDEATERLRRICEKTEPLGCGDYSTCIEDFRWGFFYAAHCGPFAEAMLLCLDTQATVADFWCFGEKPAFDARLPVDHCSAEYDEVRRRACLWQEPLAATTARGRRAFR